MPLVLPPILFKDFALSLWPSDFLKQASLPCPPAPWVQQYLLLQTLGVSFLCALNCLFRLQGLDLPLELLNYLLHRLHGGVLGRHVVGLRCHLGRRVSVCVSEVSH